ncbi:MAG TPA: carboxypeptidase-like regulatory domain-containing protein [Bryobacteraceae bacterium]|jgi:hypothetical protein|nr:carboxypeptidase-like regulatory domain-containing protein [Bryobacteraceae bacterium]
MRSLALPFCFSLLAVAAFGQNTGVITGSTSAPAGVIVSRANVQAKNTATGTIYKATSSAKGKYTLADLPAGTYDVSATAPILLPFSKQGVSVAAGKTEPLDIQFREGTQLSTLGEDPTAIGTDQQRHAPPSGPTPHTADGKPDFSGVWWQPTTVDAGKPEFLPWAVGAAKERADNGRVDSPQTHCLPGAVLRLGPVWQFVQSKDYLVEISDDDSPGFHQIYLNRKHAEDPNPAWYGDSVGRWEGDTLVVDRVAFDDRVWLDQELHPHTGKLHVIERYRRPDLGHMEIEITVEDPGTLVKPWTMKRAADLAPTEQIYEFICGENNKDIPHLVRK